jgi:hypothetical protein
MYVVQKIRLEKIKKKGLTKKELEEVPINKVA